jgi:mono/diheme cytochrome c family protein
VGIDLDGKRHHLGDSEDCPAVVVTFLAPQCPISNGALPTLSRMSAKYRGRRVEFYGVLSLPTVSRAEAVRHRDEYRIPFPVLFDASGELRRTLEPTHTPQALVLSPAGEVLYSGRIDNRHAALNRQRDAASEHNLEEALQDVLAGLAVRTPRTEPVGCQLEEPPSKGASGEVTFNRHIAPLVLSSCAECHRAGEAAPFPLLTYADVTAHARQIVEVTRRRIMPPWHAAEGFGHFREVRRLSDEEVALFDVWLSAGMPEGDPFDRPVPPRHVKGWRMGKPDLVLKMSEPFPVSADGPDVHQHFVLSTGLRDQRLVSALEFRPGNSRVVHHASFYIDVSGAARKLEQQQPDVGYGSFPGPGFHSANSFRSWLPGMSPQRMPRGTGTLFPAHCDLVVEIHYKKTGKPERDQSSLGLHFAESSARLAVMELQVLRKNLEIPAGAARHHHHGSYTLPVAATLLDAAPHMHLLGREMKAQATRPDGTVEPLVWVKDWDFNWQGQYVYVESVRLPKGTRIDVECWYDNSTGNALNPNSPPREVRWGDQTQQEMGICLFRYTCDTREELQALNAHHQEFLRNEHRLWEQRNKH